MQSKIRIITSLLIVVVLLGIIWTIFPVCFQNNDDKVLLYLTAGYTTGTPEMGTVFGSFYYYGIICWLYNICAGIPWYTIIELLVIGISLWVICDNMLDSPRKAFAISTISYLVMFALYFVLFSTALQYTATAGLVAGAAVCSLINGLDKKFWNSRYVISLILIVLAYGIRKQFGLVGIAAMLFILFISFFEMDKKTILKRTIVLVIIFMVAFLANSIYENKTGISDFNDYYASAGTWIDYPHLEYADDVDGVYESVGWDETLYNAATKWFFMDENLTKENFDVIENAYDPQKLTIRDYMIRAKSLLEPCAIANTQVIVWIGILVLFNCLAVSKKISKSKVIKIDGLFICFVCISTYFLMIGRFPLRAYEALVYIFAIPSIVAIIKEINTYNSDRRTYILLTFVVFVLIFGCSKKFDTNSLKYTYLVTHDTDRQKEIEKAKQLEQYAINHPDNMYIYDYELSLPTDPFQIYTEVKPKNLVFWGGWVYNTPMYWKQVHANSLETLYLDDFITHNVYFCGPTVSQELVDYMKARVPNVNYAIEDEYSEILIYRFR